MDKTSAHSIRSSYREALLEHLFAGELMRRLWLAGVQRVEVLKPQVDEGGYDLVIEANSVVRHIQLKASFRGSKVSRFNVSLSLQRKPSGCLVCIWFDPDTLELGPFGYFGGAPGAPLPSVGKLKVAKHTKGNAKGVKLERPNLRVLPLARIERGLSWADLQDRLFGPDGEPAGKAVQATSRAHKAPSKRRSRAARG